MEGADAAAVLARTHAQFGTTSLLATTMTAQQDDIERALGAIRSVMDTDDSPHADILGVHLEGPFINGDMLGSQPPRACRGTVECMQRYLALAPIRLVTLAPEMEGHDALIAFLTAQGIRVQIGHTCASYDQCMQALTQGASGFTHLYNAMTPLKHRDPGAVGAARVFTRSFLIWCMSSRERCARFPFSMA